LDATRLELNISQTVSAVMTFILAMTLYPEVQRKAQAEIDQIVGNSRLPDFSDEGALPYVEAVLKEALRWHPVTPLGMFLSVAGIISPGDGLLYSRVTQGHGE
jgi:cytochrome P450